jgi:hypothetical protein
MKNLKLILFSFLLGPVLIRAEEGAVLRVAVFPFESNVAGDSPGITDFVKHAMSEVTGGKDTSSPLTLGEKISELLSAQLSNNPAIQLVEREKINKAFDELALGQTGLVTEEQAARIGHMVGAQVLVTGKSFPLDSDLFIVAKVIGVETTRVFAAKTNGPLSGKLSPLVNNLGDQLSKILLTHDRDFLGKDLAKKDVETLIAKALGSSKRPVVTVHVKERHMNRDTADPAVETELIYLLQKSGFELIDERNQQLGDWAKAYLEDSHLDVPKSTKADVVIVGEAFSEFAARRGDLVSCKARVELRALDAKTSQILAIERKTQTAVNIAENIAAKSALQEGTRDLAATLIPQMVKKWNGGK